MVPRDQYGWHQSIGDAKSRQQVQLHGRHLRLQGLVPDDVTKGVVRREHDFPLVGSFSVAFQRGARHWALLLAA